MQDYSLPEQDERKPRITGTGISTFLLIFSFLIGLGVLAWQHFFAASPINLWIGIGLILVCPGIIALAILALTTGGDGGLGCVILAGALIGIGYGIYFAFFAPSNIIPEFYSQLRRPDIVQSDLAISLDVSPAQYIEGDEGRIVIALSNTSDKAIEFYSNVTLPINFFDGFVIKYPTNPSHTSLSKGFKPVTPPTITFSELRINPKSTLSIEIPIVAVNPGDYSGGYIINIYTVKASALKGNITYTEDNVNIVILP